MFYRERLCEGAFCSTMVTVTTVPAADTAKSATQLPKPLLGLTLFARG